MATIPHPHLRPWSPPHVPPIRPLWLVIVSLLLAAAVGLYAWNPMVANRAATPNYQTAAVTRGTLRSTIAATGPVANLSSVPLGFKSSGRIAEVRVSLGEVDQSVSIRNVPFTIVGVLASKGSGFGGDQDDTVLIPFQTAQIRLFGATNLNSIVIQAARALATSLPSS